MKAAPLAQEDAMRLMNPLAMRFVIWLVALAACAPGSGNSDANLADRPAETQTPPSQATPTPRPTPGSNIRPPAADDSADTFRILGLRGSSDATPSFADPSTQYTDTVIEAVTADLASWLTVAIDSIQVVRNGFVEVAIAAPCGTTLKSEEGEQNAGLTLGYEVIVQAGDAQYRYVAVGGLGHYCGQY
jgi:hypothetical protein